MSQVQALLVWNRPNPPLLHGESAEEDLDVLSVLVEADIVDDPGEGRDRTTFDPGVEKRLRVRLANRRSERRPERRCGRPRLQQSSDRGNDVRVAGAGIEQRPEF